MNFGIAIFIIGWLFVGHLATAMPRPPRPLGRDGIVFCNDKDRLSLAQEAVCQLLQGIGVGLGAGLGTHGNSGEETENGKGQDTENAINEL